MYVTDCTEAPAFASPPEHFDPVEPLRPRWTGREIIVYSGVSLDDIARDCMARHFVLPVEFYSLDRTRRVAHCRFEFMWRASRVLAYGSSAAMGRRRYSLSMIGRHFEVRGRPDAYDHTSVLHGIRKWRALRKEHLKAWIRADNDRLAAIHGRGDA